MPMLETDPVIIDAQIAAILDRTQQAFDVIGNLYLNLPDGMFRSMVHDAGMQEVRMTKRDPENPELDGFHSPRAYEVTWDVFFADVDKALEETGTSLDELQRLQHRDQGGTPEEYFRSLLPVYKYLRMLGYSHYDLRR